MNTILKIRKERNMTTDGDKLLFTAEELQVIFGLELAVIDGYVDNDEDFGRGVVIPCRLLAVRGGRWPMHLHDGTMLDHINGDVVKGSVSGGHWGSAEIPKWWSRRSDTETIRVRRFVPDAGDSTLFLEAASNEWWIEALPDACGCIRGPKCDEQHLVYHSKFFEAPDDLKECWGLDIWLYRDKLGRNWIEAAGPNQYEFNAFAACDLEVMQAYYMRRKARLAAIEAPVAKE